MSTPHHLPQRLPDWVARLNALVIARLAQPFAWGANDCGAFAADAAQAITGIDVLAELRGRRRSERAALRQLRAAGGVQAALQRAGYRRVQVASAQRGDVVLLPGPAVAWPVLAVCTGAEALAPGPDGLAHTSICAALEVWRL